MKFNKKGIGTASSFLIALLIGVAILVNIGTTVTKFSAPYGVSEVEYFAGYTNISEDISASSSEFIGGYDLTENSSNPEAERKEDFMFWKAFKIIDKIPSLSSSVVRGIGKVGADLGIPTTFTYLIITCLVIVLITLVIKVIRGYNEV